MTQRIDRKKTLTNKSRWKTYKCSLVRQPSERKRHSRIDFHNDPRLSIQRHRHRRFIRVYLALDQVVTYSAVDYTFSRLCLIFVIKCNWLHKHIALRKEYVTRKNVTHPPIPDSGTEDVFLFLFGDNSAKPAPILGTHSFWVIKDVIFYGKLLGMCWASKGMSELIK